MGEDPWAGDARTQLQRGILPYQPQGGLLCPCCTCSACRLFSEAKPRSLGPTLCQSCCVGARDHPCCQEGGTLLRLSSGRASPMWRAVERARETEETLKFTF